MELLRQSQADIHPVNYWLISDAEGGTPANPGGALDLSWQRTAGPYLDLDARKPGDIEKAN